MPVTINLKTQVDVPTWQYMRYAPVTAGAGSCCVTDRRGTHRYVYFMYGVSSFWRYDTITDSFQQMASPGALGGSGTWGAGTVMIFDPTNGAEGRLWLLNGYTTTAGWGYYDIATDTWTARTVPGGAFAVDAALAHTDPGYHVSGNGDHIYLAGNNGTVFKRYVISTNTWSDMAAAPGTIGAGCMMFWGWSQDPNAIYLFRGNGTSTLYKYSISGNSWSTVTTIPSIETLTTGSSGAYMPGKNGYAFQKDNSHRMYFLDLATNKIEPFGTAPYIGGTAHAGDALFDIVTADGLRYLYFRRHSATELFRTLVFWK
jgi:hypothetical protein